MEGRKGEELRTRDVANKGVLFVGASGSSVLLQHVGELFISAAQQPRHAHSSLRRWNKQPHRISILEGSIRAALSVLLCSIFGMIGFAPFFFSAALVLCNARVSLTPSHRKNDNISHLLGCFCSGAGWFLLVAVRGCLPSVGNALLALSAVRLVGPADAPTCFTLKKINHCRAPRRSQQAKHPASQKRSKRIKTDNCFPEKKSPLFASPHAAHFRSPAAVG
jgi:hypothetical protein